MLRLILHWTFFYIASLLLWLSEWFIDIVAFFPKIHFLLIKWNIVVLFWKWCLVLAALVAPGPWCELWSLEKCFQPETRLVFFPPGPPQKVDVWTWDCGLASVWLMLPLLCVSSTARSSARASSRGPPPHFRWQLWTVIIPQFRWNTREQHSSLKGLSHLPPRLILPSMWVCVLSNWNIWWFAPLQGIKRY